MGLTLDLVMRIKIKSQDLNFARADKPVVSGDDQITLLECVGGVEGRPNLLSTGQNVNATCDGERRHPGGSPACSSSLLQKNRLSGSHILGEAFKLG